MGGAINRMVPQSIRHYAPDFIRNFRAAGRLSWLIFFMFSFYFLVFFARWVRLQQIQGKKAYIYLTIIMLLLGIADIVDNNLRLAKGTTSDESKMEWGTNTADVLAKKINPADYQGIMMLPYYHIGAELVIEKAAVGNQMFDGYIFSLASGLPMTNMNATRCSVGQAKEQIALFHESNPGIIKLYENKKPFLLYVSNECRDSILNTQRTLNREYYPREKILFKRSTPVAEYRDATLYKLEYDSLYDKR